MKKILFQSDQGLSICGLPLPVKSIKPAPSSGSHLLQFTSLTCKETSRKRCYPPLRFESRVKPGWPFHVTYQQTDARADRNTGCPPLHGLGGHTPLISVWPRPGRLRTGEWVNKLLWSQCNASNPCSRMSEMLLLAVNFDAEVSIHSMKDAGCWKECFYCHFGIWKTGVREYFLIIHTITEFPFPSVHHCTLLLLLLISIYSMVALSLFHQKVFCSSKQSVLSKKSPWLEYVCASFFFFINVTYA